MQVIGLAGPKGVGKSTVVEYLIRQGWRFSEIVHPIKLATMQLFGLSEEEAFNDDLKDVVIDRLGKTPRQLQCKLGRILREVDPDLVIRRTVDRLRSVRLDAQREGIPGVVVSAVRFEAEAQWLRTEGARLVHISRPCVMFDETEETERRVTFESTDLTLHNPGDCTYALHRSVDRLLIGERREVA